MLEIWANNKTSISNQLERDRFEKKKKHDESANVVHVANSVKYYTNTMNYARYQDYTNANAADH